jgi:poly(3-hydroxybutyrate) depolymerase
VVLHGSGMSGKNAATTFTGLATRGPAAGVTTVFPDGWGGVWHDGGPLRPPGVGGWMLRRRAARHGDLPSERRTVPVETVARDWAAGNGIGGDPVSERLASAPGDPPVTRLTWSAPGCPPVVLYRIEGGGHGWPGGPQFLPARVIGPIPRHLDATGILLEMI